MVYAGTSAKIASRSRLTATISIARFRACSQGQTDFAQLVKLFDDYGQFDTPEARYCPPRITEVTSKVIDGKPDPDHISTSFVERQNLTMRTAIRRFTRLTNAFSKKVSHLKAAIALHFAFYNFCRVHASLRINSGDAGWNFRPCVANRGIGIIGVVGSCN